MAASSWDQPCAEEHLALISMSITDWRALSPFLGLTEAEEMDILGANPHSVLAQKIAMLRKWKQKKGIRGATYNQLCRVFRLCRLIDLEDEMKQIVETNSSVDGDWEAQGKVHGNCFKMMIVYRVCYSLQLRHVS